MPDEAAEQQTETTAETVEPATEQTETAAAPAVEATEPVGEAPPEGKPEEFDAKRAQDKIRKANSEAASLRKRLKELEPLAAKAKEIEDAQKTEAERLQAQLADREQQITKIRKRAVRSEIRALSAAVFADPTDPEALLDVDSYIGDDGDIDTDQIKTDLADLLARKPHLGKPKPDPDRRRPAPDLTQASGANHTRPKDPADEFAGFVKSRLLKGR